jgi:hypothetical protein
MSKRNRRKQRPETFKERFALPPRFVALVIGAAIGAAWGVLMWVFFSLTQDAGARDLIYIAGTSAMIGGGVAAIFGAVGARKRGERLFPRSPYRRNRSR